MTSIIVFHWLLIGGIICNTVIMVWQDKRIKDLENYHGGKHSINQWLKGKGYKR